MAERAEWQHLGDESRPERLWYLASELDASLEGMQQRRKQKRARLELAGMILAQGQDEDWTRSERDISGPPEAYPKGVSPASGALHTGA